MKEVNDLQLQIDSKKPFLALILKAKASIPILPKLKPKMWYFCFLMILNQLIGQVQINLQDHGFVRISTAHLFSNWQSKEAIQKSPNWNLSSKLFEDDSNDEKILFVGFVSSHKMGTLLTSFHIHSSVVFHTDLQKNTIVTCTLT